MRLMALGGVGVICGAGYVATAGPDVERVVAKPPAAVYAAFSSTMQDDGPVTIRPGRYDDERSPMAFEIDVDKVPDKSIDFRMLIDKQPALTIKLRFEPLEEGRSTKLLADVEMDRQLLTEKVGFNMDGPPGIEQIGLPMVVGQVLDKRIALLNQGVSPPTALRLRDFGLGAREPGYDRYYDSKYARVARQHAASAPMMSARPMVNPTAIARQHMRGE